MFGRRFELRRSGDGRGDDTPKVSARHRATSEEREACYKPDIIFDASISTRIKRHSSDSPQTLPSLTVSQERHSDTASVWRNNSSTFTLVLSERCASFSHFKAS
ncbi:uncharacterized [Tachysurus ichikawai]